jgi:hypothetical protein
MHPSLNLFYCFLLLTTYFFFALFLATFFAAFFAAFFFAGNCVAPLSAHRVCDKDRITCARAQAPSARHVNEWPTASSAISRASAR